MKKLYNRATTDEIIDGYVDDQMQYRATSISDKKLREQLQRMSSLDVLLSYVDKD